MKIVFITICSFITNNVQHILVWFNVNNKHSLTYNKIPYQQFRFYSRSRIAQRNNLREIMSINLERFNVVCDLISCSIELHKKEHVDNLLVSSNKLLYSLTCVVYKYVHTIMYNGRILNSNL